MLPFEDDLDCGKVGFADVDDPHRRCVAGPNGFDAVAPRRDGECAMNAGEFRRQSQVLAVEVDRRIGRLGNDTKAAGRRPCS